jgi:hypothetical protein
MLGAKENEEFEKWWQHWISTVDQDIAAKPPASGNEAVNGAMEDGFPSPLH